MGIMSSEWRGRLQHWMRTLKDDFYRPLGEISWEAFRTMDHLSQEEAMNGPFEPVEPGFTWGKTWEYCWFRGKVVLPAEAQGKRIVMDLKPDGAVCKRSGIWYLPCFLGNPEASFRRR